MARCGFCHFNSISNAHIMWDMVAHNLFKRFIFRASLSTSVWLSIATMGFHQFREFSRHKNMLKWHLVLSHSTTVASTEHEKGRERKITRYFAQNGHVNIFLAILNDSLTFSHSPSLSFLASIPLSWIHVEIKWKGAADADDVAAIRDKWNLWPSITSHISLTHKKIRAALIETFSRRRDEEEDQIKSEIDYTIMWLVPHVSPKVWRWFKWPHLKWYQWDSLNPFIFVIIILCECHLLSSPFPFSDRGNIWYNYNCCCCHKFQATAHC